MTADRDRVSLGWLRARPCKDDQRRPIVGLLEEERAHETDDRRRGALREFRFPELLPLLDTILTR